MDQEYSVFSVGPGARLSVEDNRGSVSVRPGAAGEVSVRTTFHNRQAFEYSAALEDGEVVVRAKIRPFQNIIAFASLKTRADIEITCPPDTAIDVNVSMGGVDISRIRTGGKVRASNGQVVCRECDGDWRLHTSNGKVTAEGIVGELTVHSSNGGITVEDLEGPLHVNTSNGFVYAKNVRGSAAISTSNGRIDLEFAPPAGSSSSVRASNATVRIGVADAPSLDLDVRTSNGRVEVDLPALGLRASGRGISPSARGGDRRLSVQTSNGSVTIVEAAMAPALA
jgi:DUF4097 and DUF4098 domain-containing protein YvlB